MSPSFVRRLALASAVLVACTAVAACSGNSRTSGGRHKLNLVIGDLVPLSGLQQPLGAPGQKAADLAIAQIKQAIAKTKVDHTIKIMHQNYRSEPPLAIGLERQLLRQGANCITGPWSAGDVTPAATQVTIPKKVLQITPAATSDALTRLQEGGYLNRTAAPDRLQGPALAQVMAKELGGATKKTKVKTKKGRTKTKTAPRTVSIGVFKSIYGNDLLSSFGSAWRKLGGKIKARVVYESNLPDYRKQARELVAGSPDAWVFFDFQDNYLKVARELLMTKKWTPKKTFATDSLALSTLGGNGQPLTEGLRGVAPGPPRGTPDAAAFEKLWKSGGSPRYRQPFDAQNFDAVVLCYLSAVAAGSTKGSAMKQWVRKVSAPPGQKFTWRQLPEAIKALEAGKDIDYEGASGPINMDVRGNPTFGYYDVYRYRNSRLGLFGSVSVPPSARGFLRYKVIQITPKPPGATPPVPAGPTGASGASGASGATGAKGAKKKKKSSRKGR